MAGVASAPRSASPCKTAIAPWGCCPASVDRPLERARHCTRGRSSMLSLSKSIDEWRATTAIKQRALGVPSCQASMAYTGDFSITAHEPFLYSGALIFSSISMACVYAGTACELSVDRQLSLSLSLSGVRFVLVSCQRDRRGPMSPRSQTASSRRRPSRRWRRQQRHHAPRCPCSRRPTTTASRQRDGINTAVSLASLLSC